MILGLTGGYCAGKSSAAKLLQARGFAVIDVDRLGHRALAEVADRVVARFGNGVLDDSGRLDRKKLGAVVFADPRALADHEAIVHPRMLALLDEALAEAARAGRDACIDAALLYRFPQAASCDGILELRSPLAARLVRAHARDGLSAAQALRRIARQRPLWRLRPRPARGRPPFLRFLRNAGPADRLARRVDDALASISREMATFQAATGR